MCWHGWLAKNISIIKYYHNTGPSRENINIPGAQYENRFGNSFHSNLA